MTPSLSAPARRLRPRLAVALGAMLVGAVALGGCADAGGPPAPGEPTLVRIWHQKDAAERAFLEDWAEAYNAGQDSVDVEVLYKETEELRNHYIFAAIGGKGPDLIYGPADNVGMLAITETIRPLDDLVEPALFEAFIDEGLLRYDGRVYGLADQVGNHLTLVYNRDLVETPPATFDELLAVARANTIDEDGDGAKERYGLVWNYTEPFFFIPFLTAFDGWVMDENEQPTLDNAATVKAIEFIKRLRDEEEVIPPTVDYNTAETLFKEGRAAMIINGPWAWAGYGDSGIDYALAPIPYN
ncbi:MAG TPA: extracellular solute-binding protein, partial [Rhodothermales bacterium]|nr:extracellular solute-binding protein [Rhodothermales bacterium]